MVTRTIAPPTGANPQPIEADSGLIRTDGTLDVADVEKLKRYDCRRYAACLDYAAGQNWTQFECTACTAYVPPPEDDPARQIFDRVGRALVSDHDDDDDARAAERKQAKREKDIARARRWRARRRAERDAAEPKPERAVPEVEYVTQDGRTIDQAEAEVILQRERAQMRESLLARARDDHERAAILAQWQD